MKELVNKPLHLKKQTIIELSKNKLIKVIGGSTGSEGGVSERTASSFVCTSHQNNSN